MPVLLHAKNITYADCTDVNKLRPSDWNSSHNQHWTLQGNTLGASTLSGTNIQLAGGNNITLSVAGQTISIIGESGGAAGGNLTISAGTASMSSGSLVFSNSNAISFGLDASTITAQAGQIFTSTQVISFGRSAVLSVPYIRAYHSNSFVDVQFYAAGASTNYGVINFYLASGTGTAAFNRNVAYYENIPGIGVSTGGNTAGTTGLMTLSTNSSARVVFVGTSNITLSQSLDGHSVSVSIVGPDLSPYLTTAAQVSHSHGDPTLALTNLNGTTASNSAGLTLSLSAAGGGGFGGLIASNSTWTSGTVQISGNGNVTVSYNANTILISAAGGGGGAAISAAGSSASNGTVVFSNSNNVSFGMNGSTVTASASYSEQASFGVSAAAASASAGLVVYSNSNNVSFGMNGSTVTATASYSQSTAPGAIVASNSTWTSGTVVFTGSNNITVTYNASTVVISGANTHGQQTGISGIAGSAASTVTNGTVQFSNLNNVSFGLNGSTMTASVPAGVTATGNLGGVAGSAASTVTNGTLVFSNSNGVTFGLNGSTMTASISEQASFGISAAAASASAGLIVFSNSNNVSFGMNGSTITATATGAGGAAGTNTFSVAGSSSLSGSGLQIVFSNVTNVTIQQTTAAGAMTIGLSGNAPGAGAGIAAVSAGTTAATSGTLVFSNSNSISFGLNGQTVTASGAFADAMVTLTAGNLMSLSISTTSVSATVTFINLLSSSATAVDVNSVSSAGTLASRFALADHQHAIVLSNSNNVSFGWNAGTVTATASYVAGGGSTLSMKDMLDWCGGFNTGSAVSSEGTGYIFQPFKLEAPLSVSNIWMIASVSGNSSSSSNSSGQQAMSYAKSAYFFSRVNYGASSGSVSYYTSASYGLSATRSHTSNSFSFSMSWITDSTGGTSSNSTYSTGTAWQSGFFSGPHIMAMPLVTSFSAGEWFVGWRHSSTTATTGSNDRPIGLSAFIHSIQSGVGMVLPTWGNTLTNRSNMFCQIGFGSATVITTNAAMDATAISAGGTALRPQRALMVNMGIS